mmetsp:Transcript_28368/g.60139  ORF Transcript_28368/g.60139 Transcript_28368/m.60139 type:complete len:379 (+) Transcript_28368:75-1211(+)|eukprot:CAMPEP_0180716888 /NCGR_PEP_ID=MMETSP1038_2-20121128/13686_1 /TAXON_ID=632150 /ORGANISM="Azadinium spinosum, Strain 3D9" /LENGTH=378 /DNA_ID=CAMNT_0022749331 /DNA_START=33 /DNA_END=1169 /DNA_ORIENTATION=-
MSRDNSRVLRAPKDYAIVNDRETSDGEEELDGPEILDQWIVPQTDIEPDMFGMVICSLVRDTHDIYASKGRMTGRIARLLTTLLLLCFCIALQIFLLIKVKQFVSAKAVHDIREAYDKYEEIMYDETILNVNGKHRGVEGTFEVARFDDLSADEQSAVCRIPLSQPDFFFIILLIWTLTCCGELKKCISLYRSLIFNTGRVSSMKYALKEVIDEETEGDDFLVEGLTLYMKGLITTLVILPRLAIALVLTWLGCRWLLATTDFADLILNAVALEFILGMKEVLYETLMTRKNKDDVDTTKILPAVGVEEAGIRIFVGAVAWIVLAAVWVLLYMGIPHKMEGLQLVLPDYRWDVHDVCTAWIAWRYCVAEVCPASPDAV